jgi:hypothetical protein
VRSDNEARIDLLNVQYLVAAVTGIVRNQSLLPATIGVFGGWGTAVSLALLVWCGSSSKATKALFAFPLTGGLSRGARTQRQLSWAPYWTRSRPTAVCPEGTDPGGTEGKVYRHMPVFC